MSQCYELTGGPVGPGRPVKDYTRPLHVDCSVEYELPNAAKPPAGTKVEPLLMIHPCYYRRAESQRRSPFINNLPSRGSGMVAAGWRTGQARIASAQPPYPFRVVSNKGGEFTLLLPDGQLVHHKNPYASCAAKQIRQQQQQSTAKRDPLVCGGDFSSGSDSGISAGHWTDSDRSPLAPHPFRMVSGKGADLTLLLPDGQLVQQKNPYASCAAKPIQQQQQQQSTAKRDPLLCGGDFSSGSDSGISAGHWTDSDRSPLAPELRLQRDFQAGPDSGIATPVSLAEDNKTARQTFHHQTYQQQPPCSCGKTQCMLPSYETMKNCENQYLPTYEQTPFQTPGLSRYSQTQLQQWLHSVQVSLSPQRKRVAPAPPQMHRYGISPIVIH